MNRTRGRAQPPTRDGTSRSKGELDSPNRAGGFVGVTLVVGKSPGGHCGVRDYTRRLAGALSSQSVSSVLIEIDARGVYGTVTALREIWHTQTEFLHIQYPSVGFGRSMLPQLVCCALRWWRKTFVTLHEFSRSKILRKLSILPFAICARAVLVTSQAERTALTRWYPWTKSKCGVIPIGSNIPASPISGPKDPKLVMYFGLIEPRKGLEQFLRFAEVLTGMGLGYHFVILGTPSERGRRFYSEKRATSERLPIVWRENLSAEDVAKQMNVAMWAYLPFPDGASERRGSLLAALEKEVIVITTGGVHTTEDLRTCTIIAASCSDAVRKMIITADDEKARANLLRGSARYVKARNWDMIARAHVLAYLACCR